MSILNPNQLEAVEFGNGALLVVAGAGTGKTSLITKRIEHLIKNKNVPPNRILALTFTEKASKEMVGRLDEVMPLGYYEPKIATYHSFCQDILREEGHELGLNTDFKLITQPEQWMLLRKEIYNFELSALRPRNNPGKHLNDLLKLISKCVDENISSSELLKFSMSLEDPDEKKKWEEISFLMDKYQEIKLRDSKLDFGDLITWTLKLFQEKKYILKKYQEQYEHILIDEFQDTNYSQYEIVKLLFPLEQVGSRSLVVVGDDSQSIYKFRGAAISNILEFKEDYQNPKIITLNQNYRSSQEILDYSYRVIQNNNPYTLESRLGISKKLVSKVDSAEESNIQVVVAPNLDTEVVWVISEIKKLLQDPEINYQDIAILTRANSHLEPFIMELRKEGLPYQVWGNRGLYDQDEVKLVICLLNLLINAFDNNNLFRCLFIESLNIDQETIYKLITSSKEKKTYLWDECLSYRFDKNLTKFVSIIQSYQRKLSTLVPSDLVFNLLHEINYLQRFLVSESIENDLSIKNLDLFLERVKNIERSMFSDNGISPNLMEFLDYFNLILQAGDNPAQAEIADVDTINLITVHSSKGLEFKAVFMPSLINDRFPSQNKKFGFDVPDELVENKEILPDKDYFLQEERRLFYVGVTRAKKYLFLSHAKTYGKREKSKSTFLVEGGIEPREIEKIEISETQKTYIQESLFQDNEKENGGSDYHSKLKLDDFGKIPDSLSYTSINLYKTCPLRYKYQMILNFPIKQSKALSFGNTIHETLKEFHQRKLTRPVLLSELLEIYKNKFQPYGYDDRDNQIEYYHEGIRILKQYFEKYGNLHQKHVVIEKFFKFELGGVIVSGKIDRIDRIDDEKYEYEIIDYKTGEPKSDKELQNDDQLTLYALAAKNYFKYDKVKLSYFYLEKDIAKNAERSETDFKRLETEVASIYQKIKNRDFGATPSLSTCNFCDYKEICPHAIRD